MRAEQELLYEHKAIIPPIGTRIKKLLEKYALRGGHVKPRFSYDFHSIERPTWSIDPPDVNMGMAALPRYVAAQQEYRQLFREIMEEYEGWERIYTDGSKGQRSRSSSSLATGN